MINELKNITAEEISRISKTPTDDQKEKLTELWDKGWFDVAQPYWEDCKKRNYATFVLSQPHENWRMFKNNERMTKEQKEKLDKLIAMGWKDVADAYWNACIEENLTEVYKARLVLRLFEELTDWDENEDF